METPACLIFCLLVTLFKSYYVVWKLKHRRYACTLYFGLNRTMQYGNCSIQILGRGRVGKFKSYYVVWKLFFPDNAFLTTPGLNRTMQYGNLVMFYPYQTCIYSLNRTMQYGNWSTNNPNSLNLLGLNRTMQYGNSRLQKDDMFEIELFKSYYVVWKQENHKCQIAVGGFKSYYVVWKLNFLLSPSRKLIRFKSYYVVWKLFNTIFPLRFISSFKSYYVVWKLLLL